MTNLELHNILFLRSNCYKLSIKFDHAKLFDELNTYQHELVKYNPKKNIERYGLSITSLDGNITGVPDLDSLSEYNKLNNTNYTELDFNTPTKIYHETSIKNIIKPFISWIGRSHAIYLMPGSFFPPHVDTDGFSIDTFRILIPLKNSNYPKCAFLLGDKLLQFEYGFMYVINTAIEHSIFAMEKNTNVVFNIALCYDSVKKVQEFIAT